MRRTSSCCGRNVRRGWPGRLAPVLALGIALAVGRRASGNESPPIVFVLEDLSSLEQSSGPSPRPGSGGKLMLLAADGSLRELVANHTTPATHPIAYADPDISYDGRRIVFSGYSAGERSWRIYQVDADGRGYRQLTRSDQHNDLSRYGAARERLTGYDDMDPCFLPDGRICFVSTRLPAIAPDGRMRATNLYVMNPDGSDVHRITTERFGADTPTVDPMTGRIVYSRWWRSAVMRSAPSSEAEEAEAEPEPPPVPPGGYYAAPPPPPPPPPTPDPAPPAVTTISDTEFLGLNSWFLAAIDPDGTDVQMHSGFHIDRELTQAWKPSFRPDGNAYALFLPATPRIGRPGNTGLRLFPRGLQRPVPLGGPQTFAGEMADELVYASAHSLPDGSVLVTAAPAGTPQAFGIYTLRHPETTPVLLYEDPLGAPAIDAVPLMPRARPPVIEETTTSRLRDEAVLTLDEAYEKGGSFKFVVENIHFNGPVDTAMPSAPPVGKDLSIEFYMNPQRTSPNHGDPPILIHRVPLTNEGRVEVELPAGVPLFEVLRSPEGEIPVGRDGQVYHVGGMNFGQANQTARCVGCHVGHSRLEVPEDASWTNLAPSAEIDAPFPSDAFTGPFRPENLVDRSTEPEEGEWSSGESASIETRLELAWSTALQAREVRLYGPRLGGAIAAPAAGVTIRRSLEGEVVDETEVGEAVTPEGLRVEVDASARFDRLELVISPDSEAAPVGLAEIEVIARAVGEIRTGPFTRGDVDCNGSLQATDAVVLLQGLFYGEARLCCEVAGDADGSGTLNISDSLYLLNYMFWQGPAVPEPQDCGFAYSTLGCEASSCR